MLCILAGGHHTQKTTDAEPKVLSAVAPAFAPIANAARVNG